VVCLRVAETMWLGVRDDAFPQLLSFELDTSAHVDLLTDPLSDVEADSVVVRTYCFRRFTYSLHSLMLSRDTVFLNQGPRGPQGAKGLGATRPLLGRRGGTSKA